MGVGMRHLLGVALLIVLFINGCSLPFGRTPITCENLAEIIAISDNISTLELNNVNEWVKSEFADPSEIRRDTYSNSNNGYTAVASWGNDSRTYDAYFIGSESASIKINLDSHDLTVAKVIECLGAPSHYLAYRAPSGERMAFVFEVWYPGLGVLFRGTIYRGTENQPLYIMPEAKIGYLQVTSPTNTEEMSVLTSPTSANASTRLDILREWTSKWEELVYERLPPEYIPP